MISTSGVKFLVCFFEPSKTNAAAAPRAPSTPTPIIIFLVEPKGEAPEPEEDFSVILRSKRPQRQLKIATYVGR